MGQVVGRCQSRRTPGGNVSYAEVFIWTVNAKSSDIFAYRIKIFRWSPFNGNGLYMQLLLNVLFLV